MYDATVGRWLSQDPLGVGGLRDPLPTAFGVSATNAHEEEFAYSWKDRDTGTEATLLDRPRYFDSRTGRWQTREPLGYDAGDSNLYRYANNRPTVEVDPSGLFSWTGPSSEDTLGNSLTLNVQVRFVWENTSASTWDSARKTAFSTGFKTAVESWYNGNPFRIYPRNYATRIYPEPPDSEYVFHYPGYCKGIKPRINIDVVDGRADFKINVKANPPPARFIQSSAVPGGSILWWTDAWLDEDDLTPHPHGGGNVQIPAVHEFGHLMGHQHPGVGIPGLEYEADASALMGVGMGYRREYFQKWVDRLNTDERSRGGDYVLKRWPYPLR